MPTETILRLATLQDLPRVVDIYNATVPTRISTADTEPVTVESRIPWFHAHDARRPLYVFEDDGLIQAWVSFQVSMGVLPTIARRNSASTWTRPIAAKASVVVW